jgi:CheY-like chemotaxis protein
MSSEAPHKHLSLIVADLLPFLRRYARALTGSQKSGDRYAAMTLESLLIDRSIFEGASSPKVALFGAFHRIWTSLGAPVQSDAQPALSHLENLTANTREALLLHTVEDFVVSEIADIMDTDQDEIEHLLAVALAEMEKSITGSILIIEDEAIIALHIKQILTELGHKVTGVARKRTEAVTLAQTTRPSLILSDIQLADGSSGVDAVKDILVAHGDIPVIFITAFPEKLLTGERPEPAFLITKPYTEEQVRSAVSQAMFFASSAEITVD